MALVINLQMINMSKLGLKLFFVILIISLGGLLFASIYINSSIDRRFFDYLYLERKEEIENLVDVIENSLDENDRGLVIRTLVNDFVKVNKTFLILTDNKGNVIYLSQNQSGMMNGMMNNGMMRRGHNIFSNKDMNNFIKNSERFTIEFQGETAAYLYWYTGRDANISERAAIFSRRVNRIILLTGILVAIITIIISLYFSRYLTGPLIQMNKIAGKVSKGDFNHHVEISGNDELSELGYSFNEMVAKLKYLEKIRKESTSDLAHELRTPLTTINSYLEGIKEDIIKFDQTTIREIEEELQRLISLVNRLGDLANAEKRIINSQEELVSISDILKNIIDRYKTLASRDGINLDYNIQPGLNITADPKNLETIIINLISNALKYTPEKGEVYISLEKLENNLIIKISDTGIGISEDDLPYIFERFYRADKSRSTKTGGTGIGLTITRELIHSINGTIEVSSQGKGTKFTVKLPSEIK